MLESVVQDYYKALTTDCNTDKDVYHNLKLKQSSERQIKLALSEILPDPLIISYSKPGIQISISIAKDKLDMEQVFKNYVNILNKNDKYLSLEEFIQKMKEYDINRLKNIIC